MIKELFVDPCGAVDWKKIIDPGKLYNIHFEEVVEEKKENES